MECNCLTVSANARCCGLDLCDKLHLLTPEEDVGTYTFNKHIIKHHFCQTCGIHPYAEAVDPEGQSDGRDQYSLSRRR